MYREAGARRGVHFNPECPHSVLTTVERGLKSDLNKYTQVYAWGLVVFDNEEIEVATAAKRCVKFS